jgi:branched-chain amino acid transport system substrate-binding protein
MVVVLAGLSACSTSSTNSLANKTPITVGYSASLTGSFAADGKALQQGFQIWANTVNASGGLLGRPVQLVGLDDGSAVNRVTANYQTLITKDHVDLLLGPYSSLLAGPAATTANKYNYALFAPTGNAPSVYNRNLNNVFVVTLPSQSFLETFADYILSLPQSMRPQTAAYVTADSPFTTPQVQQAEQILSPPNQIPYVTTVFSPSPYGTNANIPALANQIAQSHADIVVLGTSGLNDCVAFIKAFKADNYNPKAIIATSGPGEGAQFLSAVGTSTAEDIFTPSTGWYSTATTYQNTQFTHAYVSQYGGSAQDINATTAEAFAAGQLLDQAVTQAGDLNNAKLIQVLHNGAFNSILGPLQFNSNGSNKIGIPALFQWEQGQLVVVYPTTNAQKNPVYPKSAWS